ncbi:CHAT domain-containing protein [Phormidium tenue FACHB-886]|nr:CHAT domain-containing protein [Phormidium tenue FACHB-886]
MALVCIVASPSAATVSMADTVLQQSQNSAERLEQQGRSHYAAGQFAEAVVSFQQAAQVYRTQQNELKQAIALSNLALAAQQLGRWAEANQAITQSLNLLEAGEDSAARRLALAEALEIQSALLISQGKAEAAFDIGEHAATLYEQLGNRDRATESRISQAQALQVLGLYRRAIATLVTALGWQPETLTALETLNTHLQTLSPSPTAIAALQSLGEALRVTGNLAAARAVLQQSLAMAQQLQQPEAIAAAQFRLANLTWTEALVNLSRDNLTQAKAIELVQQAQQGDRRVGIDVAEEFYRTSASALALYHQAATATTATAQLQAQLNQLRIAAETNRQSEVQALLPQVQSAIDRLPLGRMAIEARINLAQTLINVSPSQPQTTAQILAIAIGQARELQDPRAESNAMGLLGRLYEQTGQFPEGQQVTQQALLLAQNDSASDLTYRWQWQLGRVLKAIAEAKDPNRPAYTEAIAAYTAAVDTLKSIRADLIATAPDEQLSFQTTIEPIYRQLVSLLLQSPQDILDDQNLRTARDLIESLQLAELDNFFREACLNGNPTLIDQVDQTAAIIYPIILPDRLTVIVSLPQSSSQSSSSQNAPQRSFIAYTTVVPQDKVEATVNLLRDSLDQANDNRFLPPAQQLYDWLIRPVQAQLVAKQVNTLVFVLDGVLRNIPMSVLHDGQQYLVEQPYSIALTPGLQLLGSQPLSPDQLSSALLAGVSESRQGYSALPNVRDELAQIQAEIPKTTTLLDRGLAPVDRELRVNGGFTNTNFETAIESTSYPIVHLATHGQFSSQLIDTYVLTENGRLTIDDLRTTLQTTAVRRDGTLELLVLSACSTATGDNQAALGLAGVAVRAGARSTVATLWQVNDYSSAVFMGTFYRELSTVRTLHISKATALQQAQRSLLQHPEYQHPYFWAPYVLIGNWQ